MNRDLKGRWRTRRIFVVTASLGLMIAAAACGADRRDAPQSYNVSVDAPSPAEKNFQYASFFPAVLRARPGDSVVFENRSTQAPHIVSFGVNPSQSNAPAPTLPGGAPNPARMTQCYSDTPPSAALTTCANESGRPLPVYAGKGYWNSGWLVPAVAPEGPKTITMRLAESIAPGTYLYLCVLHRPMVASIEVVASDAERDTPSDVSRRTLAEIQRAESAAAAVPEPMPARSGRTFMAVAGTGQGAIAVNRFYPATIAVETGTTVAWNAQSDFEPHTITFGSKWQSGADDPASFAPAGIRSGGRYSGGLANSGFLPAPSEKAKPIFSLVFTKPGRFAYVCVLHPGMEGIVEVT